MQGNLSIKGISVQNIYSQYSSGKYIINRRYQRKLVWGVEEKKKFIDSLLQGFPIPMIIVANHTKANGDSAFEVLDGMQRLNAITSFIEGEFPVNGKYYNLESVAQTKVCKENGTLSQKNPVLENSLCSIILDYPVPFSICDNNDITKVDESFRRINTGGRTLSKQDLRQAGALGKIPDLIRDCSIYVRGDSSHSNIVELKNMKNISLSTKGLGYGIDLNEVFWAKHGIITYENIRMSRDEELVSHLVSYIADSENAGTTSTYLDYIYDSNSDECETLNLAINKTGSETIYRKFHHVFDIVKKTFESNNLIFKNIIFKERPSKVSIVFQVIFIAFYKALIVHNLEVGNYKNLANSLNDVYDKHLKALNNNSKWHKSDRESLSESIYGVIRKHFKPRSGTDRNLSSWVANLENILNESKTEQVCYDFKLGLHQINNGSGDFNQRTFDKIIKTLTAMTNTKVGDCYVILGVADKENDAITHRTHFGSEYIKYNEFCIVGIDGEAKTYHTTIENYEKKILQLIERQPITDTFKKIIKTNLVTFTYNNREILLFKASRGSTNNKPERYDGDIYTRNLSHLEKVTRDDEFDFFDIFRKESSYSQN
ncbi:DUF262 domain-containing protein [Psychrobacter sp. NPDC064578]|uniref:GmrSD restriction endonuclease domain-containing protein n=1 Tax=Psychrobacter sp. NPDC064578 TaxID=3364493 RepID=UPI00385053AE